MVDSNIFFDLSELAHLGEKVIIGKTVRIRKPERCRVGDYSIIDDFTYVSSGLTVGRYTHVGANAAIIGGDGNVSIGDFVNIAPGCRLVSASHDFVEGGLCGPAIPAEYAGKPVVADIEIADHVLFGTNTVVLPGTVVPEGVATGAFTLLTPKMKLEPWTLYVGIPGKQQQQRNRDKIQSAASRLTK